MGFYVAERLAKKKFRLSVFDIDPLKIKKFKNKFINCLSYNYTYEAIKDTEIIITCLPNSNAVKKVFNVFLKKKYFKKIIFLELSTISPEISKLISNKVSSRGGKYYQIPLFGTPNQAREGNLYLLVAAKNLKSKKIINDRVKLIINSLSTSYSILPDVEVASKLKIIQNGLGLIQLIGIAECLYLCYENKINPKIFIKLVKNAKGMADSPLFDFTAPKMLEKNQLTTALINTILKDAKENKKLIKKSNNLSIIAKTERIINNAVLKGYGNKNYLKIYSYFKNEK